MVNSRGYLLPTAKIEVLQAGPLKLNLPSTPSLIATAIPFIAAPSHTQWLVSSERSSMRLSVRQLSLSGARELWLE
jgi:hypothetical protein